MLLLTVLPKYTLDSAFEIRLGNILQPKYKSDNARDGFKYRVVYSGDFAGGQRVLDINGLTTVYLNKEIKKNKELRKDDYLISAKGGIKGFSLFHTLNTLKENELPLAASNNLIIVRPKEELLKTNDILYLHNLLDLVVTHIRETAANTVSTGGTQQSLTIRSLAKTSLNHIDNESVRHFQEEFSQISEELEQAWLKFEGAKSKLSALNKEFAVRMFI